MQCSTSHMNHNNTWCFLLGSGLLGFNTKAPVAPNVSLGPFAGWGRGRGSLCPPVGACTAARWPSAAPYPQPPPSWWERQRWDGGSRSGCCLQKGRNSGARWVGVRSPAPSGAICRGTDVYGDQLMKKEPGKGQMFILPVAVPKCCISFSRFTPQRTRVNSRQGLLTENWGATWVRRATSPMSDSRVLQVELSDLWFECLHGLGMSEQEAEEPKGGRSVVTLERKQKIIQTIKQNRTKEISFICGHGVYRWQHCCLRGTDMEGTLLTGCCQPVWRSRQSLSDGNCCGLWEALFLPGTLLGSSLHWQEGQTSSWERAEISFVGLFFFEGAVCKYSLVNSFF